MKINDDHLYHGAALTQIVEHSQFTAINAFTVDGRISRSSFLVNNDIAVFLKYAEKPTKPFNEYSFTFHPNHLNEIESIEQKTFVVLVCVRDRQICCILRDELMDIIEERKREKTSDEDSYTILVTMPDGKSFRVYTNYPGKRKKSLKQRIVSRTRFPDVLFKDSKNA